MIDALAVSKLSPQDFMRNYSKMQEGLQFACSWVTGKEDHWSKWRTFEEMNDRQKATYNYRMILDNEIVFDFEDKESWKPVSALLEQNNLTHLVWDSGGRGVHIHVFFK